MVSKLGVGNETIVTSTIDYWTAKLIDGQ